MSTIGTFTKTADGAYTGAINTLSLNVKAVAFRPNDKTNPDAPDYRIFAGKVELGAAWKKTSAEQPRANGRRRRYIKWSGGIADTPALRRLRNSPGRRPFGTPPALASASCWDTDSVARSPFQRSLVASAVPNPEYCRIVHGRPRYMVGYTPRV